MSDHYDAKTGQFTERRKVNILQMVDDLKKAGDDIVQKVKEAGDKAVADLDMQLNSSSTMLNIRFQHLDANIDTIRDGMAEMRKANEEGHRHIIDTTTATMKELLTSQDKVMNALVDRFTDALEVHSEKMATLAKTVDENKEEQHSLIKQTNERINQNETATEERFKALEKKLEDHITERDKDDAGKWRNMWIAIASIITTAIVMMAIGFFSGAFDSFTKGDIPAILPVKDEKAVIQEE